MRFRRLHRPLVCRGTEGRAREREIRWKEPMAEKRRGPRQPSELLACHVRMTRINRADQSRDSKICTSVEEKLGCSPARFAHGVSKRNATALPQEQCFQNMPICIAGQIGQTRPAAAGSPAPSIGATTGGTCEQVAIPKAGKQRGPKKSGEAPDTREPAGIFRRHSIHSVQETTQPDEDRRNRKRER